MRLGVDIMGGDRPPSELFLAVTQAAQQLSISDTLVVFASQDLISQFQKNLPAGKSSIEFVSASQAIEMDEPPLQAIRRKRDSSLALGIASLKQRETQAFISAGNTGALLALSTMSLQRLPGIDRPALLAVLPTEKGVVAVLDVGGNVTVKSHHLVQFALMGAAYQRCHTGKRLPRVGLLNIGGEAMKGTSEVQLAYNQLKSYPGQGMEFVGNVEGRDVFHGAVDVLVTDGFTGNIFLKTAEGVSLFLLDKVKASLTVGKEYRFLSELAKHVDYEEYSGAILCGIDGVVVKCHGQSSARGMLNGILGAAELVKGGFNERIRKQLIPIPS